MAVTVLSFFLRLAVLVLVLRAISADEYIKDLRRKCQITRRPFFCASLRIAKLIQDFDYEGPDGGIFKIVKVDADSRITTVMDSPRFMSSDGEWDKFVKFVQRKLVQYLGSHSLAVEIPDGVEMVQGRDLKDLKEKTTDDPRGHKLKEKKIFILSVIIMAKLVKIFLLVNMIFYVLLFIKKIILVTAVVFPSVLSHIKQACQQQLQHQTTIAEEPVHSWFGWRQDQLDRNYWPYQTQTSW